MEYNMIDFDIDDIQVDYREKKEIKYCYYINGLNLSGSTERVFATSADFYWRIDGICDVFFEST
jgi:hypothetical protein